MLRRSLQSLCAASFADQYASTGSGLKGGAARELTSLHLGLPVNRPGALFDALKPFQEEGLNLDYVQSRERPLQSRASIASIFLHVPAKSEDPRVVRVLENLKKQELPILNVLGSWTIPWFPTKAADLDLLDQNTLAAGSDLADDPENPHPGFHDQEYRQRRKLITEGASNYRHGEPVPRIEYTKQENETWAAIWDKLVPMYQTHACEEHRRIFPLLIENAGYCRERIPQVEDVSRFLQEASGFSVRPVAGLLSARDFFNALAFRVFYSTQYIRHHSKPLYTPEPDVCHELLGHAPLFADPSFADFSQEFGLLSLGASDDDIEKLAHLYWYTVEFGLCKEGNGRRAFGAGLLSSFGELEYSLTEKPEILPWDPYVAAIKDYPITTYQPTYFLAESFDDAQKKLRAWGQATIDRPFRVEHLKATNSIRTWATQKY